MGNDKLSKFFLIVSFLLLPLSLVAGWFEKVTLSATSFIGFAFLLIFSNLDRFSKFKATATGIEAELRAAIDEAHVTIEEFRALSILSAEVMLSFLNRQGRWGGGYSKTERNKLMEHILETMRVMKMPEDKIEKAMKDCYLCDEFDYASWVMNGIKRPTDTDGSSAELWYRLKRGGIEQKLNPAEVELLLKEQGVTDKEAWDRLEDYKHYCQTRQHRRPELWFARNDE